MTQWALYEGSRTISLSLSLFLNIFIFPFFSPLPVGFALFNVFEIKM